MESDGPRPTPDDERHVIGADGGDPASVDRPVHGSDEDYIIRILGRQKTIAQGTPTLRRRTSRFHLSVECSIHPGAQCVPEGDQVGMGGRLQRGPLLVMPD
jgi:hypothetical protein